MYLRQYTELGYQLAIADDVLVAHFQEVVAAVNGALLGLLEEKLPTAAFAELEQRIAECDNLNALHDTIRQAFELLPALSFEKLKLASLRAAVADLAERGALA